MIGFVLTSIILYFIIYRLVEDKGSANFKAVMLLVALPCITLILIRFILNIIETGATANLVILLSALLLTIFYIFYASKTKFKLSNMYASIVSIAYFVSIWTSEYLHNAFIGAVFT